MTVRVNKPAVNLREELASLRNQGDYSEQQFYFDSLVTNGTFDADTDWTKGTGWTISGGQLSHASGSTTNTTQVISLVTGRRYRAAVEVISISGGSGSIQFRNGGTTTATTIAATGTFEVFYTAEGNNQVAVVAGSGTVMTVDNVSVFEVDANNDVIHTMPKGWKPKDVFEDGLLQREGAAHDYEVVYDGFDYKVKPTVAPSATTETCVIGVKT